MQEPEARRSADAPLRSDELPQGWRRTTIGDICQINPGLSEPPKPDTDVSFVPMAAVSNQAGGIVAPQIRKFREVSKGYTQFKDGDVIWAKITPCMENGKAAVARNLVNGTACGSTEFFVLRSTGAILPDLLYKFLRQVSYRNAAANTMSGAVGQARVPKEFLQSTPFDLPPLAEQRRIVARLEQLEARSRRARAALADVPALLAQARQSLLAAAFRGDLTKDWRRTTTESQSSEAYLETLRELRATTFRERTAENANRKYQEPDEVDPAECPPIPKSWSWASADAVCSQVTDGEHIQPAYQSLGYPMLSAKHVREGFVNSEGAGLISKASFDTALKRCKPENGDVLIVSVGATTGRAAIVANCQPFAIVRSVLLLKPLLPGEFLLAWLQSPWCFRWMTQASGASAQAHLYIKDTKRMPVPAPPLAEQREIVRRLERALARLDAAAAAHAAAVAELDRLDQSLLARAFRGELVPQDPADEPASTRLEALRAAASSAAE